MRLAGFYDGKDVGTSSRLSPNVVDHPQLLENSAQPFMDLGEGMALCELKWLNPTINFNTDTDMSFQMVYRLTSRIGITPLINPCVPVSHIWDTDISIFLIFHFLLNFT